MNGPTEQDIEMEKRMDIIKLTIFLLIMFFLNFFIPKGIAAPPVIFKGSFARFLTPSVEFNTDVRILSGSLNPSSTAVDAPAGSLYLSTSGTVYRKTDAGSTTNWTDVTTATSASVQDSTFSIYDNADVTKIAKFESSGITTGTTRTFTFPNANTTLLGHDTTAILTGKSFDADGSGNSITNIEDADIKAGAAITRAKLANGTNDHVLINSGAGVMSSEAQLANTRGGTGANSSAATGLAKVSAGTWTFASLLDADVSASAGITLSKLAATTASRALVSDGSGFITPATTTSTQIGYLSAATGTTGTTSTNLVYSTSPTLVSPALGTPTALVGTNISGTAASLTAGTVTTNANLTGPITSSGNTTAVASQTGTGSVFVMQASPTLTTPNLGTPSTLVGTNISGTAASLTAGNVTTNANLTGHITSTGNAAILGSFSSSNLLTALTDESGSGAVLGGTSPTIGTATINSPYINGGTASNTVKVLLPTETTTNLAALTQTSGLIAYDSTKLKPVYNNGTSWQAIGTGSTAINYISANPDAESDTTGWVEYTDAAGSVPVDGTGGASAGYWTRTTTTPLRGNGSFLYSHPASNTQGTGIGYAFTTDVADQGKVLQISFDYTISSGTFASTSSTSDLIVYIYDVTNAVLIQPAGIYIQNGAATLPQKQVATFQTASNSTSYRLILHSATSTATAYTMRVDNVSVGPQVVPTGTIITDWQSYTPTFNGIGTVTSINFFWRRNADQVEVTGTAVTGTVTAAELRVGLPSVTSDSIKVPAIRTAGFVNRNAASAGNTFSALIESGVAYFTVGNTINTAAAPLTKKNGNDLLGNSETFSFYGSTPVSGWGSTTNLSDSTDTRVVAASLYLSGHQTISSTADTKILLDSVLVDTHGGYSANKYTFPVSGVYSGTLKIYLANATASEIFRVRIYKNGSAAWTGNGDHSASDEQTFVIPFMDKFIAGDYLEIYCDSTSDASYTVLGVNAYNTSLTIERLSGPATIAASETVSARYNRATTQAATNGNRVDFTSKEWDSHGSVSGTGNSWAFTAPVSGRYLVNAEIGSSNISVTVGQELINNVYCNGSLAFRNKMQSQNTTARQYLVPVSGACRLLAGQTIYIQMGSDADFAASNINGNASDNYIDINRVGNY